MASEFTWLNQQGVRSDQGFEVQFTGRWEMEYREGPHVLQFSVDGGLEPGTLKPTLSVRVPLGWTERSADRRKVFRKSSKTSLVRSSLRGWFPYSLITLASQPFQGALIIGNGLGFSFSSSFLGEAFRVEQLRSGNVLELSVGSFRFRLFGTTGGFGISRQVGVTGPANQAGRQLGRTEDLKPHPMLRRQRDHHSAIYRSDLISQVKVRYLAFQLLFPMNSPQRAFGGGQQIVSAHRDAEGEQRGLGVAHRVQFGKPQVRNSLVERLFQRPAFAVQRRAIAAAAVTLAGRLVNR